MAFINVKTNVKTVDLVFRRGYIPFMARDVEYTDEFETWWVGLDEE